MTCYLWCVIGRNSLEILRWATTTDRNPTHSVAEMWVLVKQFNTQEGV